MAEHSLAVRIKALIAIRALFISLLLGSSYLLRIEYFYAHPRAISQFIIALYVLTICYALVLNRVRNFFLFGYVQLVVDVASELLLISITGGIESWFSFTMILTVLSSSIILNKRAGYVIASLSSILYGTLLALQFNHLINIPHEMVSLEKEFLYNVFIHILALYLVAYLGGYLSSRLEKTARTLEERDSHLKDLESFNIKVIESLPSGLLTTDRAGTVVMFNRAAEEICGILREEVIGKGVATAIPFFPLPLKEGRGEEILSPKAGNEKIIGFTVSALRDASGGERGHICIFQDLTQFKALEEEIKAKEKWAAIGELSANIAHEIRNPLASLKGSVEMLREETLPAKHREKLMDIAINEMERLNNIVTDFLTYSTPRPLEKLSVDLHALLDDTISLLRNIEPNPGNVVITRDFDGQLFVSADPQRLRQVFWNLGVNAIEAMRTGGELTISTRKTLDAVQISFADTGPGISAQDLDRIFFPFFTTKDGGTGLGLSIAYRIVEEHNGRLMVKSVPGTRTVFEIILKRENGKR